LQKKKTLKFSIFSYEQENRKFLINEKSSPSPFLL
jgi:hypothetical protein